MSSPPTSLTLGMGVTAEGIETVEQLELARVGGCDRGQGYLFTRPLEADALATWLVLSAGQAMKHASKVDGTTAAA
jgi:EAL domain-containing protein (putative c-di-GMP-specific phosphodiesterase class I)